MALRVVSERPRLYYTVAFDSPSYNQTGNEREVVGTTSDWDWLFCELRERAIASIKLVRQLNPGITLSEAKQAYEVMKPYRS